MMLKSEKTYQLLLKFIRSGFRQLRGSIERENIDAIKYHIATIQSYLRLYQFVRLSEEGLNLSILILYDYKRN